MKPFHIKRSKSINQCTSVLLGVRVCEAGIGSWLSLRSREGLSKPLHFGKGRAKPQRGYGSKRGVWVGRRAPPDN